MRRLCLIITLVAVTAAGCARSSGDPGARGAPGSHPVASSEVVPIYLAVLRRYLTTPQDNSNLSFGRVFVIDRADAGAADPMRTATTPAGTPITPADQAAIVAGLRDVAPVEFVGSREDVLSDDHGCPTVRDQGILIQLGPPVRAGGRSATVAINGFAACLGATWFTYVLRNGDHGWSVTGTTGPMAVA